jgi:hypothetical protein
VKPNDDGHGRVNSTKGYDYGPVAHRCGQRLATLAADDAVDANTAGGRQEVPSPVGLGWQEEEYAAH